MTSGRFGKCNKSGNPRRGSADDDVEGKSVGVLQGGRRGTEKGKEAWTMLGPVPDAAKNRLTTPLVWPKWLTNHLNEMPHDSTK